MNQAQAKQARLTLVAIAALLSAACSSTPQQAMQPPLRWNLQKPAGRVLRELAAASLLVSVHWVQV